MKKFVKLLAVFVDLMFFPIRAIVMVQVLVCGSILYGYDLRATLKESFSQAINLIKAGLKPALQEIFKN